VSASELGYYVPNVVCVFGANVPVVLSYRRVPINYCGVCEGYVLGDGVFVVFHLHSHHH
jgi:hypothetical protein